MIRNPSGLSAPHPKQWLRGMRSWNASLILESYTAETYVFLMGRSARGGFGMVMLVVVMAIVLILVAKNWMAVAPVAAEIDPGEVGQAVHDGDLPD